MAMIPIVSETVGTVWKLKVEVGDRVDAGDTLLIIESMKMEIPVLSPVSGEVSDIVAGEGEAVGMGQTLVTLDEGR